MLCTMLENYGGKKNREAWHVMLCGLAGRRITRLSVKLQPQWFCIFKSVPIIWWILKQEVGAGHDGGVVHVMILVDLGRGELVQSEISTNADAAFQEGNVDDKIRKMIPTCVSNNKDQKILKTSVSWHLPECIFPEILLISKKPPRSQTLLDWVNTAGKKEKHVEAECFFCCCPLFFVWFQASTFTALA